MNYRSYADLSIDILRGIHKVPKTVQLIVGIPRSGMIPAYMIGSQLNLPVVSIDEFINGSRGSIGERKLNSLTTEIKTVLFVDDSILSGHAMNKAKLRIQEIKNDINFHFCAIYSSIEVNYEIDFYFKYLPHPRVFQWNYKNHSITKKSCYDIDGVLCSDPTEEQNDDGDNYNDFLINAKPLFIPAYTIPCLITSRLEKYRKQTEAWLKNNNVLYNELIMLKISNAEERRTKNLHATFKAEEYLKRSEEFFVESSWRQAKEIFQLTEKKVFCTENDVLITNYRDIVYFENLEKYSNRDTNGFCQDEVNLDNDLDRLKIKYDQLVRTNNNLSAANQKYKNDKWVGFSKLKTLDKVIFLLKLMFNKIK